MEKRSGLLGPTLIYDKSAIHSFAEREAYWLEHLYCINITPTLFMEVMADLKKVPNDLPLSEAKVRILARKFSPLDTYHNIHHRKLQEASLLGHHVEMGGRTIVGGATQLTTAKGEKGIFIDENPEERALNRWQDGNFKDFEHDLAKRWREATREIDLQSFAKLFRKMRPKGEPFKAVGELIQAVNLYLDSRGMQYRILRNTLYDLGIAIDLQRQVIDRWKGLGKPPVRLFAPYAIYCHAVNVFFYIGLGEGLLSTRATNRIDLQYLYYLPFCKVFTSGDKFHRQIVPLFLSKDQFFLEATKLKGDLKSIADMWDNAKEEIKKQGTRAFMRYPPTDMKLFTAQIWDRLVPDWRDRAKEPPIERTPEEKAKTMKRLSPMMDAIKAHKVKHPVRED